MRFESLNVMVYGFAVTVALKAPDVTDQESFSFASCTDGTGGSSGKSGISGVGLMCLKC